MKSKKIEKQKIELLPEESLYEKAKKMTADSMKEIISEVKNERPKLNLGDIFQIGLGYARNKALSLLGFETINPIGNVKWLFYAGIIGTIIYLLKKFNVI